jgi:hypothetical protein
MEHTATEILCLGGYFSSALFSAVYVTRGGWKTGLVALTLLQVSHSALLAQARHERGVHSADLELFGDCVEVLGEAIDRAADRVRSLEAELEANGIPLPEPIRVEAGLEEGGRVPVGELLEGELAPGLLDEAVER